MSIKHHILTLIIFLATATGSYCQSVVAGASTSVNAGCSPLSVNFTNTSTSATSYFWDFGNGTNSVLANPTIAYLATGTYTVKLISYGAGGTSDTLEMINHISIVDAPVSNFTLNQSGNCQSANLITFTNTSANSTQYLWDFGDGGSSTLANPTYQYTSSGTFTITLLASNALGCSDVYQFVNAVNIDPSPVVDFVVDTNIACDPAKIYHFTDITPSSINTVWEFGDGNTGSSSSASHAYNMLGAFDVTAYSTNALGCTDSLTKLNFVENIPGLPASYLADDQELCIGDTVFFTNTSSFYTSTNWDFGDGNTSSLEDPYHVYGTGGMYDITFSIVDINGCVTVVYDTSFIDVNDDPVVNFYPSPSAACTGDEINFVNNSTGGGSYWWVFGDGTVSSLPSPVKVYNAAGTYNVELYVISPAGCQALDFSTVTVSTLSTEFTADQTAGCAPFPVQFTNGSVGATTWFWDFGDGNTSNVEHPNHIYNSDSSYTVTLMTSNGAGCFDTVIMPSLINVVTDTLSLSLIDTLNGCLPFPVDFSNNIIGTGTWFWDFGDGNSSSSANPTHVYTAPGIYTVTLTTLSPSGCYLFVENYAIVEIDDFTAGFTAVQIDCSNMVVAFQDTSNSGVSWFWNFGDGTTSTEQNPVHVFTDSLSQDIYLSVVSSTGCMSNILVNNFIDFSSCTMNGGAVPPEIIADPGGGAADTLVNIPSASFPTCAPINVYFHSPFANATSWSWDFGDGTTSTDEHTYHLYLAAGMYDITLIAQSPAGPDTLILDNFVELIGPTANFSSTLNYDCTSTAVQFTDLSSDAISWSWNFGDSTLSNLTSPMHTYPSQDALIPVSLVVMDTNGCSSSYSTVLSFTDFEPDFIFEDSICFGNSAEFTPLDTLNYSYFWDFGDGSTSSNNTPQHEYMAAGSYLVQVVSSHALGCTKSTVLGHVTVIDLVQDFIVTDSIQGCPGDSFTFTPAFLFADYYEWDVGYEEINGIVVPTFALDDPGFYTTQLVTHLGTCVDTVVKSQYIQVWDVKSEFTVDQIDFCDPFLYELTSTSTNAFTFDWHANGTIIPGGSNMFTNLSGDSVIFSLSVSDIHGCVDTSENIIFSKSISTGFTSTLTNGCAPHQVDFISSSENATTWLWDFGDGNTSTLENPSHTYNLSGNYDVMLIATSVTGNCSDTVLFTNYIQVSSPVSDFTLTSVASCAPMVANFFDNSVDAISWNWDFGDGAYSTLQNPLHVYTTPGYFDVALTVFDANGCSNSKMVTSAVFVPGPIADFITSPTALCDSGVIQFTDLSIGASTWSWIFGDGSSSAVQNPNHAYTSFGAYSVALIVEDTMGCVTSLVLDSLISIYETPQAEFTMLDSIGCISFSPIITNSSAGHDNEFWDMGDGNQFTSLPVPYNYSTAGNYTITLTTSVANTCFDTTTHSILALGLSDATINPVADLCEHSGSVLLSAADAGGVWTGNGITDPITGNFDPSIAGAGVHTIIYEISGSCGDIDSIQINVIPVEDPSINPVTTLCGNVLPFYLSSPGSGTWSGTGIVDPISGLFDPTVSGNGLFTIVHTTTNGICSGQDSVVVQVAPQLDASFNSIPEVCDGAGHQFFTATNPGGIWSGTGIVNVALGEFDPIVAGVGIHNITYSLVGTCGDTLTKTVTVNETPIASITASSTIGCSIHDVQFYGTSGTICNYSWEFSSGDTSSVQNPNITFGPGQHDVQLIVTANGCSDTANVQSMVVVHDSVPTIPEINRVTVTGDNCIQIEWKQSVDPAFDGYVLYRENIVTGLFEQIHIQNAVSTTSFIDYGVNTLTNSYCYKLTEQDICGNEISITEAITHCTVNIEASISGKHHVDVSWSPYSGASISGYELYRCVDTDTTLHLIATVDSSTRNFTDPTSYCNLQYTYKVKALNIGGTPLNSWSDSARVVGSGIEEDQISHIIRATVLNDESVWIEWTVPEVGGDFVDSYEIYRSTDSLNFVSMGSVSGTVQGYNDLDVEVMEERYFYKIEVINQCPASNNIGEIGTSILLQSEKISETKGLLNWTPYQGWQQGVEAYQIQMLNEFNEWVTVKVVDGTILNSTVDF